MAVLVFVQKELKMENKEGLVKCLGWCNKEFFSKDVSRIRFCSKCKQYKEQVEQNMSKIVKINFKEVFDN